MDCREFLDRYSDYDDSLIAATEVERFRAHMAACASCARYDRVLRKGRMIARQIPRPEPSPDFVPRLQRRLLVQTAHRRGVARGARMAAGLAAATVLVVAVSVVQVLEPASSRVASSQPAARAAAPAATAVAGEAAGERGVVLAPRLALVSSVEPRAWAVREVAPAGQVSYSPLETGPPVYRSAQPSVADYTEPGIALD